MHQKMINVSETKNEYPPPPPKEKKSHSFLCRPLEMISVMQYDWNICSSAQSVLIFD